MKWLLGVLLLIGCHRVHGEHRSEVHVGGGGTKPLQPAAVDLVQTELTAKLAAAGLTRCTWAKPRELQDTQHPVAWFCGKLGTTRVEGSINRPGFDHAAIELDLRADVSGSRSDVTTQEAPVIADRDAIRTWMAENVQRWWKMGNDGGELSGSSGCCPSIGTSGAILGDAK
ncbi:MAG TPA: hypothetical protein VGC41_05910 [Kofleriaceae bacterium]